MDGFASQFYALNQMENARKNWQNIDGIEALKSMGKGARREALLGGDKIEWYRRKPTLGGRGRRRGGEAHIP